MKASLYFKLTKPTTLFCANVSGIVFTSISAVLSVAITLKTGTSEDALLVFLYSFVLGNILGVLICSIAFLEGLQKAKGTFDIYSKIPAEMKDDLGLEIIAVPKDYRKSYLTFKIVGFKDNSPVQFKYEPGEKEVYVSIPIVFGHISDFGKTVQNIQKKYRKESITLNGYGLTKVLKRKKWRRIDEGVIDNIVKQLYFVAENENLTVFKYYSKVTWPPKKAASQ